MSTLRIKDAPLLPNVDGSEKIPTGGRGDYSVSVDQIKTFAQGGLPKKIEDHINDTENPHQVTKEQVGLGNVDNTSDVDKPISTATQEALDLKANQSTTYTKIEVDGSLGLKADKAYVDSRDLLKADKTYVDSALSGFSNGAAKFYPTLAAANADITNIALKDKVEVGEVANGGTWYKATAGTTSLTKSAYDPLTQAKNYTDAYATVKSKTLAAATDFNDILEDGVYKVVSNVAALTMINCPSSRAGVLEVLTIGTTALVAQRYTPYNVENKVYYRTSNNGIFPAVWQELLVKSNADNLYSTKTELSNSISLAIGALLQYTKYGEKYSESEKIGTSLYGSGYYVGLNSITTQQTTFNAIKARIINTDEVVEYRVYMGSPVTSNVNGYLVAAANMDDFSYSGACQSFPKSDNGKPQDIVLDQVVSIPDNTPFVIAFKSKNNVKFNIAYHSTLSGNLEDRSFNLSVSNVDWSALTTIGNANKAIYVQAGFELVTQLPDSSGGGVTPEPTIHVPDIVLPTKILTMKDLESNIFFSHILKEDYKDYLVDITCTKGKQYSRKWVYNSTDDTANTATLTLALHDKKTGNLLTSKTTTVQNIASSANAGTKNVLVIGDSYVNAGVITQTLLDNAVNDVTKINLIGTRGTGLNKHEGRGGWKISDYATAGRTYYAFTVSGVTTQPAINSTVYEFGGGTFTVQELNLSGGSGTIVCSFTGTAPTNGASGTLTKKSGSGDATIAFSNVQSQSGNPFWFSNAINFPQYLSTNSLATPDYVIIQLGVNDSFNATSDTEVESIADAAFIQLDAFIASIKSANTSVKIGLNTCPTYADQDAFGYTYSNAQTSWRAKRNIVTWNKKLIAKYGVNANNVHVVAAGYNLDGDYNMPTIATVPNARNATAITLQKDGVHPDVSGYKQIADQDTIWIKSVT